VDLLTREHGFVVVAPSGARSEWVKDETEALLIAETRNRDEGYPPSTRA